MGCIVVLVENVPSAPALHSGDSESIGRITYPRFTYDSMQACNRSPAIVHPVPHLKILHEHSRHSVFEGGPEELVFLGEMGSARVEINAIPDDVIAKGARKVAGITVGGTTKIKKGRISYMRAPIDDETKSPKYSRIDERFAEARAEEFNQVRRDQ